MVLRGPGGVQAGSWVDCRLCREACGSDGDAGLLRPPCAHPSSAGTPPSWRPPSEPRRPAVLVDPALASGCRAPGRSLSSRWHCPRPALGPARAAAPGACGGRQQLQAVGALGSTASPHPHAAHRCTKTLLMQPLRLRRVSGSGKPPRRSVSGCGWGLGRGPWWAFVCWNWSSTYSQTLREQQCPAGPTCLPAAGCPLAPAPWLTLWHCCRR